MGSLDEEKDWIRQSQNGDPEAFAGLVTRYQHMIHSLTFRMTGSLAPLQITKGGPIIMVQGWTGPHTEAANADVES